MNRIDWIFFDIGNVIFYDLPLLARIWRHFYLTMREAGLALSFEQVLAEREEILGNNPPEVHPRKLIAERHCPSVPAEVKQKAYEYHHLYPGANVPLPGVHQVLGELGGSYHLGVIANQPPLVRGELAAHGLAGFFDLLVISDEVGLHKPDVRIFAHALSLAQADPARCLMVGDRVDNDVRPARSLGMRTVWLDNDYSLMPYAPQDEYERRYIASYLRISGVDQRLLPGGAPDARITNPAELPAAVAALAYRPVNSERVECTT
ncbi:MAG: HAD family hydrolase [Candidatus Edwardsbacteria bacterium]|nr:HAD family hydrolase [Candidatus Edwardsbacteria bacterium]